MNVHSINIIGAIAFLIVFLGTRLYIDTTLVWIITTILGTSSIIYRNRTFKYDEKTEIQETFL